MFGAFIAIAIFLTMATAIGLAVLFLFQKDKKEFNFQTLFATYFYLVAVISLMAVFVGASFATKAIASDIFGRDFSYPNYAREMPVEPMIVEDDEVKDAEQHKAEYLESENKRIEAQYGEDLFNGISMMIVGLLFLSIHVYGWRKLDAAETRHQSILYRAYIIVQLAMFGIATLATLPMALANSLRFWLQSDKNTTSLTPGEPLSFALWATPIWIYFIWLTIRTLKKQEK